MAVIDRVESLMRLSKAVLEHTKKSKKCSEACAHEGIGASRARVTTLNSRWARAAEAREDALQLLQKEAALFLGLNELAETFKVNHRGGF